MGVLEYIETSSLYLLEKRFVLDLALNESHLLINFVKNELIPVNFKDFQAFYGSSHMP